MNARISNHSEPAQKMQADVVSRRSTEESKLSTFVAEFRVVVLVGVIVAVLASLFFSGAPVFIQIILGLVIGAIVAAFARLAHLV